MQRSYLFDAIYAGCFGFTIIIAGLEWKIFLRWFGFLSRPIYKSIYFFFIAIYFLGAVSTIVMRWCTLCCAVMCSAVQCCAVLCSACGPVCCFLVSTVVLTCCGMTRVRAATSHRHRNCCCCSCSGKFKPEGRLAVGGWLRTAG